MQKIVRIGRSSLAVIIPADFIHALGVKAGERVRVQTHPDNGKVLIQFSGAIQLALPTSKNLKKSHAK